MQIAASMTNVHALSVTSNLLHLESSIQQSREIDTAAPWRQFCQHLYYFDTHLIGAIVFFLHSCGIAFCVTSRT